MVHEKEQPEKATGPRHEPGPRQRADDSARSEAGAGFPPSVAALQRTVGNAVVARMIARRGDAARADGQRVQRSAAGTEEREADRHAHEPGCGHDGAEDSGPTGQRPLLDAALSSPSRSLPDSLRAEAESFFRNDFSGVRLHDGPVAQRATEAMGAEAMTVGSHLFLPPERAQNKALVGHELSHLDKNLKGVRETGTDYGAGVTVTDPAQRSERAADTDGAAFAAGAGTAPSVTAQRAATERADLTPVPPGAPAVQRMPDEGEGKRKRADTTTGAGPEQQRARTGEKKFRRRNTHRDQPGGNRPAELRMLDRIGRILYQSLAPWDKQNQHRFRDRATPHFAVSLENGRLHVSGNTDRPFTEEHKREAERRLKIAVGGTRSNEEMHASDAQDLVKIRVLLAGEYEPDEYDPAWMTSLDSALRTDIQWDIATLNPQQQGPSSECVHGEMNLLGRTVAEWVAKGPAEGDGERKQVPLGGYMRPCKPCSWLIESVNAVFGSKYGFRITTLDSHEGIPPKWHVPDWLVGTGDTDYKAAWELLRRKATKAGASFLGSRLNAPKQDRESKYAPRSDSEYDEM